MDWFRDPWETRGLLGDHHRAGMPLIEVPVDVSQEVDGLQVLPATVLVWYPLALGARVVEVEHRGHRIDP